MSRPFSSALVVPAALAGIGAGATFVALEMASLTLFSHEPTLPVWTLATIWAGILIVFSIGFLVLGIPAWVVAHYFNRRHWYDSLLIGAILAGAGYLVWSWPTPNSSFGGGGVDLIVDGHYTPAGWLNAIKMSAIIAAGGAVAGLTIWSMVYRHSPPE